MDDKIYKKAEDNSALVLKNKSSGSAFALYITLYLVVSCIGQILLFALKIEGGLIYQIICSLYSIVSLFLILLYFSKKQKRSLILTAGVKVCDARYYLFSLLLSVGMLFGLGFINSLVEKLVVSLGGKINTANISLDNPLSYISCVIFLALFPAIFEESFFRGLLLDGLSGNSVLSFILTAVCFALYHGSITQLIYQLIYGYILALLTFKSGSTLPSMATHFLNNFLILTFEFFSISIDLLNPVIILCGIAILSITLVFLFLDKKEKFVSDSGRKAVLEFLFPFGIYAVAVCTLILVLNMVV